MSNFKANIERIARTVDDISYRETGKPCNYLNHRGDNDAVMLVDVDVSECCKKEENEHVRLCWRCASHYAYRDAYYCKCQGENSEHKAVDLTFKGEIQSLETVKG